MLRRLACAATLLRPTGVYAARVGHLSTTVARGGMSEIDEYKFLLGDRKVGSLHDFEAANAAGEMVKMSEYSGKAVLIVNVASL